MKITLLTLILAIPVSASTISVVLVHEPLSLHGTDVDDIISDTGEALQATVLPRPMAITGALPEALVEAVRTPHKLPTNSPNFNVVESNLLILCQVGIGAEMTDEGLLVKLDVTDLTIPPEVDLTSRQLLKLTLVAIQRTLENYHKPQSQPLIVIVGIVGTTEKNATLTDLQVTFTLQPAP